jgi:CBS domain-containing protein
MHGLGDWQVLDIRDVERSTVAAVSRLFEETGLTHVPVMETGESGEQRLRGLLSGAKVRRLLSKTPAA